MIDPLSILLSYKWSSWSFVIYFSGGYDLHILFMFTCLELHSNWATNSQQQRTSWDWVVLSAFPLLELLWKVSSVSFVVLSSSSTVPLMGLRTQIGVLTDSVLRQMHRRMTGNSCMFSLKSLPCQFYVILLSLQLGRPLCFQYKDIFWPVSDCHW